MERWASARGTEMGSGAHEPRPTGSLRQPLHELECSRYFGIQSTLQSDFFDQPGLPSRNAA
jgi:hypothetical protein